MRKPQTKTERLSVRSDTRIRSQQIGEKTKTKTNRGNNYNLSLSFIQSVSSLLTLSVPFSRCFSLRTLNLPPSHTLIPSVTAFSPSPLPPHTLLMSPWYTGKHTHAHALLLSNTQTLSATIPHAHASQILWPNILLSIVIAVKTTKEGFSLVLEEKTPGLTRRCRLLGVYSKRLM